MTNNTSRTGTKAKSRRIILRGENEDVGQLKAIFEKGVGPKSTSRNAGNGMVKTVSNFRRKKGLGPDRPQIEVARPMTHLGQNSRNNNLGNINITIDRTRGT